MNRATDFGYQHDIRASHFLLFRSGHLANPVLSALVTNSSYELIILGDQAIIASRPPTEVACLQPLEHHGHLWCVVRAMQPIQVELNCEVGDALTQSLFSDTLNSHKPLAIRLATQGRGTKDRLKRLKALPPTRYIRSRGTCSSI